MRRRVYKEFTFEAAHRLPDAPPGHPNARIHGHSFRVRVTLEGEVEPATGMVLHFETLAEQLAAVRQVLDHNLLNEIDGLENPTLEIISGWLWGRLAPALPTLAEIELARDSCHEGCIYRGPES